MTTDDKLQMSRDIKQLVSIHNDILDLYNNTLYEDSWDDSVIQNFESLLADYNTTLEDLRTLVDQYEWEDEQKKRKFFKIYHEVIEADNKAFNATKIRHDAYLTYRSKRKSIIKFLCDACGIVRRKGKNYPELFDYFNKACAKVKLYDNMDNEGGISAVHTPVLKYWLQHRLGTVLHEINNSVSIIDTYTEDDLKTVFAKYVHCREMAYAIFNMITSTNEVNGYKKYHNILDAYCNAELNDKQYERLYQAVQDEDEFMPSDDYQQHMDQLSWNMKGIYEDRFYGLFVGDELRDKTKIKQVNMVPRNANQCKILSDGRSIYTGVAMFPGDIIEICPTKQIDKSALYSKDMRDIVFEVERNEKYVIPFGYCQYYDIADEKHPANCDYIWDPNTNTIVIKALLRLPKDTKLYLNLQK